LVVTPRKPFNSQRFADLLHLRQSLFERMTRKNSVLELAGVFSKRGVASGETRGGSQKTESAANRPDGRGPRVELLAHITCIIDIMKHDEDAFKRLRVCQTLRSPFWLERPLSSSCMLVWGLSEYVNKLSPRD